MEGSYKRGRYKPKSTDNYCKMWMVLNTSVQRQTHCYDLKKDLCCLHETYSISNLKKNLKNHMYMCVCVNVCHECGCSQGPDGLQPEWEAGVSCWSLCNHNSFSMALHVNHPWLTCHGFLISEPDAGIKAVHRQTGPHSFITHCRMEGALLCHFKSLLLIISRQLYFTSVFRACNTHSSERRMLDLLE